MSGRGLPGALASTGSPCSNTGWTICAPSSMAMRVGSRTTASAHSTSRRCPPEWELGHDPNAFIPVRLERSREALLAGVSTSLDTNGGRTMKFSLEWLKDYLETGASLGEITAALNAVGHEVEGVEDPATRLNG